ncbi:MAG: IS4/IS5 family transposase, partial [Phototrophicales bacterium]
GVDGMEAFVADREFSGVEWFKYLVDTGIPFVIRIKKNHSVHTKRGHLPVIVLFSHLRVGESMTNPDPIDVMGQTVWLVAYRLPDPYVILATNMPPEKALMTYKKRWSIETLFGNLKS